MNLDENELKDLFVLRETGECVFHENYSGSEKLEADQTIMSSFLSAIEAFATNVDKGTNMLETTNFRFVYHRENEYIYVARTAKSMSPGYVSQNLSKISSTVNDWVPKEWNGNVGAFQGIGGLVNKYFNYSNLNSFYEITGKDSRNLNGIEGKIYSFLRFRGRSKLSEIAKLMRIPEVDAEKVAEKLTESEYLSTHSYS